MSETATSPEGKLYVRPHRAGDPIPARLVIENEWCVLIFADRTALEKFAEECKYSVIEGGGDDDDSV